MNFGSVCSGIEAASVAWHPLGYRAAWLAEIEAFPAAVLAHHYPEVPNLGDMTQIATEVLTGTVDAPDVLVGGTPCQAFSVAGMRAGLQDARGKLTIEFVRLADAIDHVRVTRGKQPSITVWENVPGVLSDRGNAFGCFLGALAGEDCELQPSGKRWTDAGCVYGPKRAIAWRVLDAQYFGLAQRRRRVFVVASAREGFDPASVLFEREGVRRDTPPRRGEGQNTAGAFKAGAGGGSRHNSHWNGGVHPPLSQSSQTRAGGIGASNQEIFEQGGAGLVPVEGFDASEDGTGRGQPIVAALRGISDYGDGLPCLRAKGGDAAGGSEALLAFQPGNLARGAGSAPSDQVFPTLKADHGRGMSDQDPHVMAGSAVRRLTPVEAERLQGFPDNWTRIPWRGKPAEECPDGPRYKALGNSMAVPVMRWIGERIALVASAQMQEVA